MTTAAVTTTASATAIFGIHTGETCDVIGYQGSRCRQDPADCQSQQSFLEQHDVPPLRVASSSPYRTQCPVEFPAAHGSGRATGMVINVQQPRATAVSARSLRAGWHH
ncbi:hypothetical protein EMIT0196MI5_260018 [Pseudomonas sp. IT-196MI5]